MQDMVRDTLALLIHKLVNVFNRVILSGSRAAAPKGMKTCRTKKEFLTACSFIHLFIPSLLGFAHLRWVQEDGDGVHEA